MPSFTLLPSTFSLSLAGGNNETFGPDTFGFSTTYSFAPTAFTDGTGSGAAKAYIKGQLVLTALSVGVAPSTGTANSGGSIAAGTYTFKYTYYNASGETTPSAASSGQVTTGSASTVTITAPALPSGATGINVYLFSGGAGQGKVGTAASNAVTLTTLTVGAAIPTLNSATIAGTIDLTAIASPSKSWDFTGTDHGNGSGGSNGVKIFWLGWNDSTAGQIITVGGGSNPWTNGLGGTRTFSGVNGGTGHCDSLGIPVSGGNKIITIQAKYGTPTIDYTLCGEASWQ